MVFAMSSLIFKKKLHLPEPDDNDRRAYDQRIRDTAALGPLVIPLSVMKRIPAHVEADQRLLSCIIGRTENGYTLIDIGKERSYAVALDLGTTNIAAILYDNVGQTTVLEASIENPQIAFGSDILTRAHYAMSDRERDIYAALTDGVNLVVRMLCERAGIKPHDIHAMTAAGNTIMSHFFLGLDISSIPMAPFVPVVRTPGFFAARDLSLDLNPEALVYVFPNAGSYVGGDIVAGILAADIHNRDSLSVLIDVGTNAEIVIGNKEWMLVGAGAAGPALEEGICRIGKRATNGIIYDLEISNGAPSCKTFDNAPAQGICGSGMVSLLYALYEDGSIDRNGMLRTGGKNVIVLEDELAYALHCGRDEPLTVRQSEIHNFMKSKAAMFTLLLVLTRSLGITFRDITSVCVSGALGSGIDARKAAAIGMLPEWPSSIIRPLGNTSLEGARMLLKNAELLSVINSVTARITYKHMHDDPEFMKEYLGAVFIPHTNPELLKAT